MNKFPSKKVYVFTFVIILIYMSFDFFVKGKREFFQLNYDWRGKEIIYQLENVLVDSISHNFLKLKIPKTKNKQLFLNTNNTFSLENKFFFRPDFIDINNDEIIFRGIFWINYLPEGDIKEISLSVLELPLIQEGDKMILMIGDSQLTWRSGKYTRKKIARKIKELKFIGSQKDVFGYPYESELLNNTTKVLENISKLENADIYILFLGAHEKDLKNLRKRLELIIDKLIQDQSKLILVIPPNYTNTGKDGVHNIFEKTYNSYAGNSQFSILDLGDKKKYDPNKVLMEDGIHLNALGHELLTNDLIKILKEL